MAIRCAVITGYHGYDVIGFGELFASLPGVDAYIQALDVFLSSPDWNREAYDCLLFYFMPKHSVDDPGARKTMDRLAATMEKHAVGGKGIVVLHHAILSYQDWDLWTDLTGLADRGSFGYFDDQHLRLDIAQKDHPIVKSIGSWEMQDETYTLSEPTDGSNAIITTEFDPSMKTIAWTRSFRGAPVFCFESGHDAASWMDHNFREVLRRGILWSAGKLR